MDSKKWTVREISNLLKISKVSIQNKIHKLNIEPIGLYKNKAPYYSIKDTIKIIKSLDSEFNFSELRELFEKDEKDEPINIDDITIDSNNRDLKGLDSTDLSQTIDNLQCQLSQIATDNLENIRGLEAKLLEEKEKDSKELDFLRGLVDDLRRENAEKDKLIISEREQAKLSLLEAQKQAREDYTRLETRYDNLLESIERERASLLEANSKLAKTIEMKEEETTALVVPQKLSLKDRLKIFIKGEI